MNAEKPQLCELRRLLGFTRQPEAGCDRAVRRDKCDPTVIWKLADRYLSSFNDISMLMYRQEFQKRLLPFRS